MNWGSGGFLGEAAFCGIQNIPPDIWLPLVTLALLGALGLSLGCPVALSALDSFW